MCSGCQSCQLKIDRPTPLTRLIQPETAPSEFSGLGCAGSFPIKIYFRITQISHRRLDRFRYTRKWCFDKHYPTVHEIELQCVIFDRDLLALDLRFRQPTHVRCPFWGKLSVAVVQNRDRPRTGLGGRSKPLRKRCAKSGDTPRAARRRVAHAIKMRRMCSTTLPRKRPRPTNDRTASSRRGERRPRVRTASPFDVQSRA